LIRCGRVRLLPARLGRWQGRADEVGARCGIPFANVSQRRDAEGGNRRRCRRARGRVDFEATFRVGGARSPETAAPNRDPARRAGGRFRRRSECGLGHFGRWCMRSDVRIVAEVAHAIVSHDPCRFGFRRPPKEAWYAVPRRSRMHGRGRRIGLNRAVAGREVSAPVRDSRATPRGPHRSRSPHARRPDPGGNAGRRVPEGDAGRGGRGSERSPVRRMRGGGRDPGGEDDDVRRLGRAGGNGPRRRGFPRTGRGDGCSMPRFGRSSSSGSSEALEAR
jgi:hypothetical protein